jgi:hypothetical protein
MIDTDNIVHKDIPLALDIFENGEFMLHTFKIDNKKFLLHE